MEDSIRFKGEIIAKLFSSDGKLKNTSFIDNAVTAYGMEGIIDQLLVVPSINKPTHMELGTGTPTTTKLGTFIVGSRTAIASKVRSEKSLVMQCTFPAGVGTGLVREAGVFNSGVGNAVGMYCSAYFSVFDKAAGDSLELTWTLTAL